MEGTEYFGISIVILSNLCCSWDTVVSMEQQKAKEWLLKGVSKATKEVCAVYLTLLKCIVYA